MSTTIKGDLHGWNTEDSCEFSRLARKYNYTVTASGGGTVKLKIEHYTGDQIGVGPDYVKGKWVTLIDKFTTDSGQTTQGSFTLPLTLGSDENGSVRFKFTRAIGTKGVDYEFFMDAA